MEVAPIGDKPPVGVDDGWASYRPALTAAFGSSATTVRNYSTMTVPTGTRIKSAPNPAASALPAGYVALKGEALMCNACGYVHGTLNQDLPEIVSRRSTNTLDGYDNTFMCCVLLECYKFDPASGAYLWFIKGRGFV